MKLEMNISTNQLKLLDIAFPGLCRMDYIEDKILRLEDNIEKLDHSLKFVKVHMKRTGRLFGKPW